MIPRLVSVIIPTYDRPDYLREAVDSVFAQTYPFIEILVIDDGSSAGGARTKSALKPYLSPDSSSPRMPKITYLYQKNCGLISAVNRGLALAQGEYIQRLDDDDRLLPEKIARSVDVFQAHSAVGLVATGYYHIDAVGKRIHTCPPRPCTGPTRLLNMLMWCVSACAGVMVRSLVHQKVGVYRNIKAQDYEMWVRVAKEFEVETLNLPLAEYRQHPGSSINITDNRAKMEQDILNFTDEQIQSTPLEELIPNLRSRPHAYALRAAVYLQKDGEYARGTPLAKAELEKGLQLAPNDPLLRLWEGVLAVHEGRCFPQNEGLPSPYRAQAETLVRFSEERKQLSAQGVSPSSPEAVNLRRQFGKFCSTLVRQTFKTAVGKQ
jgi:glycosyltransferase involved in cell wall biosynthesis